MKNMELKHEETTDRILKAFFKVYGKLGYGFLEKVYENALVHELKKQGLTVSPQLPIQVSYDDIIVGEYFADIAVADKVIIEIKAARQLSIQHEAQLLNYLKATAFEVGLLLNFGPKAEFKRRVFSNARKTPLVQAEGVVL
jgi:GxxExxY protein